MVWQLARVQCFPSRPAWPLPFLDAVHFMFLEFYYKRGLQDMDMLCYANTPSVPPAWRIQHSLLLQALEVRAQIRSWLR